MKANFFFVVVLVLFQFSCDGPTKGVETGKGTLVTNARNNIFEIDTYQGIVGRKEYGTLMISYKGDTSLGVFQVDIVEDENSVFKFTSKSVLPLTLEKNITKAFVIQFQSNKPGSYKARIRIKAPGAENSDKDGYIYIEIKAII